MKKKRKKKNEEEEKNGRWSESVKKKERKKKKKAIRWVCEEERREKVKKRKKNKNKSKDMTSFWPWVLEMCVYLPKCHHNSISITQKHQKVVLSFANLLLKNQRIEWWKKNLENTAK